MGLVFGGFWGYRFLAGDVPNHFLCTGAAQTHISKSKLAFRARFGQPDARFYAQAQWFRTLCTGAVVSQNCAKPMRLCMKITRLQNRQKPPKICQFGAIIGALLARFGRFCPLSAPPAALIVISEMGMVFGGIAPRGCSFSRAGRSMEAGRGTVPTVDSSNPRSVASGARLRSCYYYYYSYWSSSSFPSSYYS